MSDPYRNYGQDEDLAYGKGYNEPNYSQDPQNQERGIIGDTFKKFRTRFDQHNQQPQQNFGYNNPSTSTLNSQYTQPASASGTTGGSYGQQYSTPSSQQYGAPSYAGGLSISQTQGKPDLAGKVIGGLFNSIQSIGTDVQKIVGSKIPLRPYGQVLQGYQPGLQSNLQSSVPAASTRNRFDSTFRGPKSGNDVKWYVDGASYMWAVSQALESARQSIWILDWWLSPELYLRRPPAVNEEWRIDKCLMRAANRGVKINIIVYKEVTQVLTLSSSHTKHALEALSPNISVFRHPDHLPDATTTQSSIVSALSGLKLDAAGAAKLGADALKGIYGVTGDVVLYWAHHEKLCLIDGNTAFMGGLDLCYGRWDTNSHPIADAHPSDLNKIVFPGQDFNNARVMDFNEVNHPFQNKLDRTKASRMGWSDVSICVRGPCVGDLMHHFVDRWNFIYDEKYKVRKDHRYQRLPDLPDHHPHEMGAVPVQQTQQQGLAAVPGSQPSSLQPGQFPPPPGAGIYTAPAWQSTVRPTTPSSLGQQALSGGSYIGQSNLPPPPAGPPPVQNQYSQPQSYPQASVESYGQPQSAAYTGLSQPMASFGMPATTPQYETPTQSHTSPLYGAATSSQPAAIAFPGSIPPSAIDSQSGYQAYLPEGSMYGSGDQTQRPVDPTQQVNQVQQQYSQYTGHSTSNVAYSAGSQGPAEMSSQMSPQIGPYSSQSTHRGIHNYDERSRARGYEYGATDSRGFEDDDSRGTDRGVENDPYAYQEHDRAFGVGRPKPTHEDSRFERYKNEARRFAEEGKFMGHDVSKYTNKLDDKVSHHIGGRIGSPTGFGSHHVGGMSCQLVRSCTKWSNGTATETSIQNAYIDLITSSRHFIYIENQFFITATGNQQKPVKNLVGKALVDRVIRASRERTPFKIIVSIPAVPAFAGDLVDDAALGTRAIMEFQYNSICRGGHSIMEEIAKAGINPMDYIRFYNLRNYDRINVTPAMQQGQQAAGMGYDDARRQYEANLGSGYAGYGEQYGTESIYGGQQQPYGSQTGQAPVYTGYGVPPGQAQSGNMPLPLHQQGVQNTYPTQPPGYGIPPEQAFGSTNQLAGAPSYGAPPLTKGYGDARGYNEYGQSQYGSERGPTQPGYGVPLTGPGPQEGQQQYQQAAAAAPHTQADSWDTVSSCYMLNGRDIRTVPWSGPPEAELDAFVSEELYIHSKVMIVDDSTVICGSANLNDRSMLGTHDSEIALVIEDSVPIQTTMAGRPFQASRFAASLRRFLFRKHLGLVPPQDPQQPNDNFMPIVTPNTYDWGSPEDHIVSDPLSDAFQSLWNTRARTNTEVYRRAFRAVPDDTIRSWKEYQEFYEYYYAKPAKDPSKKKQPDLPARVEYGHVVRSDFPGGARELKELLSRVKGTLVEMPLCFLQSKSVHNTDEFPTDKG